MTTDSSHVAPVVYLHPIALDREIWTGVAPEDAILLELPGHGQTPPAPEITMAGLVDWVVAQVGEPATYVGLSLGGMVALQLAVRAPEAVESIVVACSTPASDPETQLGRARDTRAHGMQGMMDTTLERWFTPEALAAGDHPGVAYASRRLLADDPEIVAQYWTAMAAHNVRDALGSIPVPATIVAAISDRASSLEGLQATAEAIPGARFVSVEGPHMLPLERPEVFAEIVAEHLSGLPGRAAAGRAGA
jgi:3-oxoadipate enol-lactonase